MRKGISLVALVITIIVLIILTATVVLNVGGQNSIINKAKEAVIRDRISNIKEELIQWRLNLKVKDQTGIGETRTYEQEIAYLREKNLITEEEKDSLLAPESTKALTITIIEAQEEIAAETETIDFSEEGLSNNSGESNAPDPVNTYNITYSYGQDSNLFTLSNTQATIEENGTYTTEVVTVATTETLNVEPRYEDTSLVPVNVVKLGFVEEENYLGQSQKKYRVTIENITGDISIYMYNSGIEEGSRKEAPVI